MPDRIPVAKPNVPRTPISIAPIIITVAVCWLAVFVIGILQLIGRFNNTQDLIDKKLTDLKACDLELKNIELQLANPENSQSTLLKLTQQKADLLAKKELITKDLDKLVSAKEMTKNLANRTWQPLTGAAGCLLILPIVVGKIARSIEKKVHFYFNPNDANAFQQYLSTERWPRKFVRILFW